MLREIILEVIAAAILATLVVLCLEYALTDRAERREMQWQMARLEEAIAAERRKLLDAHWALQNLEQTIEYVQVETDILPREMLWILAEYLDELGVKVEIH